MAVTSLAGTAAQAQQYYAPPPPPGYYHHWHHGERYWGPRHVVYHWWKYGLPAPPPGAVWVEAGDSHHFVLVGGDGYVIRAWGW